MIKIITGNLSFFSGRISPKFGKTCCRYDQDGKPLTLDQIITIQNQLKREIDNWKVSENSDSLQRLFYFKEYLELIQFVNEISKVDHYSGIKNHPNIFIENGDLLLVSLKSHSLNGLSKMDFELAMRINNKITEEKFNFIDISRRKNYRTEARMKIKEMENEKYLEMLQETQNTNK